MSSQALLNKWREVSTKDEQLNKDLKNKDSKILASFESTMEFGTAGIRGVMGAGTNKMNIHMVSAAAQAYAQFLIKEVKDAKKRGIVIGHDNRHNSQLFSEVTAAVLLNNGVKAYLFENNELQPTPLVSYVIRKMKLAGGAIVTASHNPKEYNGFKVYDELGGQLMPEKTKMIQEYMKSIDPLEVAKETTKEISFVKQEIIDSYVKEVLDVRLRDDNGNIKVVFSPYHGTSAKLAPLLLDKMGIEHYEVTSQMTPDPDFSKIKIANPEEGKSYKKALALARRKKADLVITTDPDADRLGVVVKYERRYKFLNGNETAALYLDYKLTQLKEQNKLPKDGYIATSNVSGDLAIKIAKKFKLKVYETHVGFKNIASLIESKKDETFVFGYEESYGFLLNPDIARDKDSLQAMVGIVEMVNYYKSVGINPFQHLKDLFHEYGIHRTDTESKKLTPEMTTRLLARMANLKGEMIGDKKVVEIQDYRIKGFNGLEKSNLVKVVLEGGTWFAIRPSGTEPKVKIYVQTVGSKEDRLMDVVAFERDVFNFIDDNTESFDVKHFSWKTVFKYFIFTLIIIGIMAFVFTTVYSQSGVEVFDDAWGLVNHQSRWIWMSIWVYMAFTVTLSAWMRKRLIDHQGQKVKLRYLVLTGVMGAIISYVTPFAIGGDAIGYWYLRRKGFQRGPLLSSFISSTIIYQMGLVIQSIILIPIGLPFYNEVLFAGDPQSTAAFVWFCIGLGWNLFATGMIFSLTVIRSFQEFIVRNAVKLLEWMPHIIVSDPGKLASTYQYEFREMRKGMRKIWTKKLLVAEVISYKLIPKFINFGAILMILAGGIYRTDLSGWEAYWTQIVAGDIASTANSMSLTPGGSGTGEWLHTIIGQHLYQPLPGGTEKDMASAVDVMWKILTGWPWLAVSAGVCLTVIFGETRVAKYNDLNNNKILRGEKPGRNSRYYRFAWVVWLIILIASVSLFATL